MIGRASQLRQHRGMLETLTEALPLALGVVLLTVVMLLNIGAFSLRHWAMRKYG